MPSLSFCFPFFPVDWPGTGHALLDRFDCKIDFVLSSCGLLCLSILAERLLAFEILDAPAFRNPENDGICTFAGIDLRLRIFCKLDWLRFLLVSTWCRFLVLHSRISLRADLSPSAWPLRAPRSVQLDVKKMSLSSSSCHSSALVDAFEVPGLLGITLPFSSGRSQYTPNSQPASLIRCV